MNQSREELETERESIRLRAVAVYLTDHAEWQRLTGEVEALTRRIVALPRGESEVVIVAAQLPLFEL